MTTTFISRRRQANISQISQVSIGSMIFFLKQHLCLALAGTQVLSRTTAKNFTLVEKNPKAIIKVNSYTKGKSDSGRSPTAGSRGSIKLEGSNGMINPGVPVADSTRNTENTVNGVFEYNQPEDTEEETKTCCWCFKISSKKSKPKQDNDISMQLNKDNSLQQPLVQRA